MKVSKPFSLFRLPAVPLTMISRYMDLREILLISLVSKKSAYIMKSILPPNCFDLQMEFCKDRESGIILNAKGPWDRVIIKCEKTGDVYELNIAQDNEVITHRWMSPDLEAILKPLLSHFAIVFNPTISITFGGNYHQDFSMSVLKHVKQLNLEIRSLSILSANISPENYKYILDEYRDVSRLVLVCKTSPDFEYRAGPDFRVDHFQVADAHWMHLEDFVNCKKVTIRNSSKHQQPKFANPEVPRALIRKWIESDCRLEHFKISSFPFTFVFQFVFQGLELRTTEQIGILQCAEITRRCDGKKATVKCGWTCFELKVID